MLDLVNAFEMIPHRHIIAAAIRHSYPLWLLRLSLAAYRLPRAIGVEGVFSRCIIATRGITAGSGFATTELRALLLDVIDNEVATINTFKMLLHGLSTAGTMVKKHR